MKTVKHLCFTSHKEVMMRNAQDVGMMINFLALNSWKHKIQILADCEMSTHVHMIVMGSTHDSSDFVKNVRRQYTRYMDSKYGRQKYGRFGEKGYFELDICGNSHIQTALSYVLRNPLHHGVTATPFAYPYSSVNDIFPVEMGKSERPHFTETGHAEMHLRRDGSWHMTEKRMSSITGEETICSHQTIASFLPRYSEWPDNWQMSKDGVFLRPCFEELKQTEMMFVSPASFQYCMFRKSDENWLQDQESDANGQVPIELSNIEPFSDEQMLKQYKVNERATVFKRAVPTDFDVCRIVDHDIVPTFKCRSVYELDNSRKRIVRDILVHEMHIPAAQSERCVP